MKALCVPAFVVLTLVCAAVPLLSSVAIVVLICAPVYGQWVKVPAGGIPKGPDGKPNLSAPAPRSADGHPDLSGVWESGSAKYILDIAADLKPGDVPFQPWAKALVDQRADGSHSGEDPPANCLPRGVPRINASPPPWRVIQKSDIIGILYESDNAWRQIFLRLFHRQMGWRYPGRRHPRLQREDMVGSDGQTHVGCAARHRTFSADGLRAHRNSNYNRRPEGLYQAVASQGTGAPDAGQRHLRKRL